MTIVRANCERARCWASLRLDGELSELEERLLEAHLERCAECRAFDLAATGLTRELRAAPLVVLDPPIALPQRARLHVRGLRAAVAAAASVAAVGLASILAFSGSGPGVRTPSFLPLPHDASAWSDTEARDLRELRRAEMKPLPVRPVATHVENARPL